MQKYTLTAIPAPANSTLSLKSQNIFITRDGFGIADVLLQRLKALGHSAHIVDQLPPQCDMVVLLDALQHFKNKNDAIAVNQKIFSHARTIAPHFEKQGGTFITVQDTGGQFGLSAADENRIYASGVTGLVKTAAQEWPKARCKAIDLECANCSKEPLAEKILAEIFAEDSYTEIGLLANNQRITLQLNPIATQPFQNKINAQSVIVVSGGARGITASCLIELAKKTKTRFVLLGRTVLEDEPHFCNAIMHEANLKQALFRHYSEKGISKTPKQIQSEAAKILANRETKKTIQTLTQLGSQVLYFAVNIQNTEELHKVLATVRQQWGTLTGIVHGAGVLADKLISQKSDEHFQQVFNTKVIGLKNLLEMTQSDLINTIVMFSSVAGRFGNPGQSDYAMANEVLNKVADQEQRKRGNHCLVKSINWGPWDSGMVTPELKRMFAERGIPILSEAEGTQIFVDELYSSNGTEIIIGGALQKASHSEAFTVNSNTHAFLKHHVVEDVPVLPVCVVMDWFARTAKNNFPELKTFACQNFRVLKGIRLEKFNESETFHVEFANNQLALKIAERSFSNYSAEIKQPSELPALTMANEKNPWPWDLDEVYIDKNKVNNALRLFHGPDFHVIESLDHVSDLGGLATLKNRSQPLYHQQMLDVLALDGVLQIAILWGVRMLGKTSLPTFIKEFVLYDTSLPKEKLQCQFHAVLKDTNRFQLNAILMKSNGQPYLSLQGLEMCVINAKVTA